MFSEVPKYLFRWLVLEFDVVVVVVAIVVPALVPSFVLGTASRKHAPALLATLYLACSHTESERTISLGEGVHARMRKTSMQCCSSEMP